MESHIRLTSPFEDQKSPSIQPMMLSSFGLQDESMLDHQSASLSPGSLEASLYSSVSEIPREPGEILELGIVTIGAASTTSLGGEVMGKLRKVVELWKTS